MGNQCGGVFIKLRCVFCAYVLTNAIICAKIKIQGLCGCTIGGAIGASFGYAIGLMVGSLFEMEIADKSIIDHIRDFVYFTLEDWFNTD